MKTLLQISKNCFRSEQITSLDQIVILADNNEAIYHKWWGIKPAKVFVMMQMNSIATEIRKGSFFKIINNKKKNGNKET